MKTEIPNPIIVKQGVQLRIAHAIGCKPPYVSLALKGKRTEGLAPKIREIAMNQFEGQEIPLTQDQKSKLFG